MKWMFLVGFVLLMSKISHAEIAMPQPIFNPGLPVTGMAQPVIQNRTTINMTRITTINTMGQHGLYSPYGMYGYPYGYGYGYGYYGYRPACYPGMYNYGGYCGRRKRRSFFLSIGGFFTLATRSF